MIQKLFSLLYDTIIISIVQNSQEIEVYVEIYKNKKLKDSIDKTFTLNNSFKKELLIDYLSNFTQDSPFYYIALLDTSSNQGAVVTCDKKEQENYIQTQDYKVLCIDEQWGVYTTPEMIKTQEQALVEYKVDYIFSPFTLLYHFFQDKIKKEFGLFLLVLEDSITLGVFQDGTLKYGSFLDTTIENEEEENLEIDTIIEEEDALLEEDEAIDSINLDDINLDDDLEDLDDLGSDLEDLDSLESIEELDSLESLDDTQSLEEQLEENLEDITDDAQNTSSNPLEEQEKSTQDFHRFSLIQNALKKYYEDDLYESDFIENIYVADSIHLSKDFKKYLQEELFANVIIRNIDISIELCAVTKKEIGL